VNLRQRLTAYVIGLHLVFFVLALTLYRTRPLVVVGVELFLLASLAAGIALIGRALQPLDYARRFHDLLADHNYAARLQQAPNDELAGVVNLFNGMLDALYQERLKLGEQRGFLDRLLEATPSAVIAFDFDDRISLVNASAQALLGVAAPQGKALGDWAAGVGSFSAGIDGAGRARSLDLLAQLEALPLGDSRLLSDADGRRYRCQRGQFFDRGFPRHFLLVEELTEELESSEKATYEKLVRVLAHEVNNTVAATGSVLDSLLYYQPQLSAGDGEDFGTAIEAVQAAQCQPGRVHRALHARGEDAGAGAAADALREVLEDLLQPVPRAGARARRRGSRRAPRDVPPHAAGPQPVRAGAAQHPAPAQRASQPNRSSRIPRNYTPPPRARPRNTEPASNPKRPHHRGTTVPTPTLTPRGKGFALCGWCESCATAARDGQRGKTTPSQGGHFLQYQSGRAGNRPM
jgi:PAS domain-containing protein